MFKVDDKVRYVGKNSGCFTSGNEYTVGGKYHGIDDDVGVITNDNGIEDGHRAYNFELVQPKFKRGDCVRAVRSFMDVTENKIYAVIHDVHGDLVVVDDVGDHMSINWDKPLFELVVGPVREVTRREMVPGQYGRVHIAGDRNVHCETMRTADEIRDAIKVLGQILEVMSDE